MTDSKTDICELLKNLIIGSMSQNPDNEKQLLIFSAIKEISDVDFGQNIDAWIEWYLLSESNAKNKEDILKYCDLLKKNRKVKNQLSKMQNN